ncbi:MAG: glycosyltransferase family 4 protein [Bacteroidales bacterium]|nr:glycosyltransferase family 4 protein [Bacteroidales bacterium]
MHLIFRQILTKMRIYVIGTRGFPGIQGGVEKHCESLYPLIAREGWRVTVFRRKPYFDSDNGSITYNNIDFKDIWTIKEKSFEAIIHSFIAALICIVERPDIVHLHNIGPSLVLPLLKLGWLKTVVTYHSPNYEHSKWSNLAKFILKTGERFVSMFADQVIFVSKTQLDKVPCKNKTLIANGVFTPAPSDSSAYLKDIGLQPKQYILAVSRFVPEKGLHDLIEAYSSLDTPCRLVIAGDADHETDYSRELKESAEADDRIVLTGYITGEPLNQIYSHARLFVLPSYHEESWSGKTGQGA